MAAIRRFPVRPDLEQYKKQAKERKQARGITLSEAQRSIAAEHGFPSWPRFRAAVQRMRANPLATGDRVTVGDGPFAGSDGLVQEVFPERCEARVAVTVRERTVDVWLHERHVSRNGVTPERR